MSGVLLLARSSTVASDMCNLILQCKVTKEYVARVKVDHMTQYMCYRVNLSTHTTSSFAGNLSQR